MIKFIDISFSDFKELVNFLKFNDDENEYHNITKRLTRFIANMNAIQSILIDNLIKEILEEKKEAEESFETFKKTYPNIEFDPEGKLNLTEIDYLDLEMQTIEMLFEQSKNIYENNSANYVDLQIYNAKTLTPLLSMNGTYNYPMKRVLYFKRNNVSITQEDLKQCETKVRELFPNSFNNIMGKFMEYIYTKPYEKCHFFIEHFLYRVNMLYKDKEKKHKSNIEFYENLSKL